MGKTIESIHPTVNGSAPTKNGNENSGDTDSEKTEKRGRPRKDNGSTGSAGIEKENIPRMVDVDIPTPEEPKKEKKTTNSKAKKKTAANKKVGLTSTNLCDILKTCSDIVGNREGFELWKLDDKECQQLAEPLSKVIARSSYLERVTDEYGDMIALIVALGTVIIPRLILQMKINNEKKNEKNQKENKPHDRNQPNNESGTNGRSDQRSTRQSTNRDAITRNEWVESIPTL